MNKKIVFLVPDISDARAIKRIKALKLLGSNLVVCGFRRERYKCDHSFYANIRKVEMGQTEEKKYFNRIPKLFCGFLKLLINLNVFKNTKCIYCINIDMLLLGALLKIIYNVKLYYEVGDILNAFLGNNILNILLRKLEQILLLHTNLLILTSPSFFIFYYYPIQKYKKKWSLLENTLIPINLPLINKNLKKYNRIKIVYHGALRCPQSIDILIDIARLFKYKCEIHVHGFPLMVNSSKLENAAKENNNFRWHGEFKYPEDLTEFLSDADLLWLIDLSENQKNSEWLLPNRLYDGLYFKVPMIALKNSETGRYIKELNIGWCFDKNSLCDLNSFFAKIESTDIDIKRKSFNKQSTKISCSMKQYSQIYNSI